MDEAAQLFDETYTALLAFGQAVAKTLVDPMQQIGHSLQQLHDLMWQIYRDAGQPYGDTEEGLHRWLGEVTAAYRHIREAEQILQYHQLLAPSSPLPLERVDPPAISSSPLSLRGGGVGGGGQVRKENQ